MLRRRNHDSRGSNCAGHGESTAWARLWAWVVSIGVGAYRVDASPGWAPGVFGIEVAPWPSAWRAAPGDRPRTGWRRGAAWTTRHVTPQARPPCSPQSMPRPPFAALQTSLSRTPEAEALASDGEDVPEVMPSGSTTAQAWRFLRDARVYVAALERGDNPSHAVMADRGLAKSSAMARVARPGRLGLLTPTKQRLAGGALTRKAPSDGRLEALRHRARGHRPRQGRRGPI